MNVLVDVPDGVAKALKLLPEQLEAETRLAAAIHWYSQSSISQERAAQLAGMDRMDFLDTLAARKVDVFVVDFDDLDRELSRG